MAFTNVLHEGARVIPVLEPAARYTRDAAEVDNKAEYDQEHDKDNFEQGKPELDLACRNLKLACTLNISISGKGQSSCHKQRRLVSILCFKLVLDVQIPEGKFRNETLPSVTGLEH